ncbi:LD-carboxypeptidase [Gammaproteobacteria bacterium]|nr:LD-carboxypeptidase [Gammaproteobacteria bacterium]
MTNIKPIAKGSTIGLITPSSPLFPGRLEASISYFEQAGYKVKVGNHNKKADRFLAGADEQRAEDIMLFFNDKEVDALIVTGGGAGSIRTLPLLDYEIIKKNPKPIIGFSDTTSLQLGIYSKTGLSSYTGFTCRDIAEKDSLDSLINLSFNNCLTRKNFAIKEGTTINSGKVTAPLIGGNLSCLLHLFSTPFQPSFKDMIFFLEDVWAEPYVIDGMLSQLHLAGIFESASGIIFGKFSNCDAKHFPDRDGNINDVINDWCKKIKVPCIKDFPYGHFNSRAVLPIGQLATLDATNCKLDILFYE